MDDQKLLEILIEIKEKLAAIDQKQKDQCLTLDKMAKRTKEVDDKVDALPCEAHTRDMMREVAKRPTWKAVIGILTLFVSVMTAAFLYTHNVDESLHEHEKDYKIHELTQEDYDGEL